MMISNQRHTLRMKLCTAWRFRCLQGFCTPENYLVEACPVLRRLSVVLSDWLCRFWPLLLLASAFFGLADLVSGFHALVFFRHLISLLVFTSCLVFCDCFSAFPKVCFLHETHKSGISPGTLESLDPDRKVEHR